MSYPLARSMLTNPNGIVILASYCCERCSPIVEVDGFNLIGMLWEFAQVVVSRRSLALVVPVLELDKEQLTKKPRAGSNIALLEKGDDLRALAALPSGLVRVTQFINTYFG
jgi:hypothetical protein